VALLQLNGDGPGRTVDSRFKIITTRTYIRSVEEFAQFFKTPPDRLDLEHDVTLSFVRELDDPKEKGKKYTTTSFDMFRFDKDHKIAEHWDIAVKPAK
jgi:predicted SnoaL-like aldol condensation-catalyzing enzyme